MKRFTMIICILMSFLASIQANSQSLFFSDDPVVSMITDLYIAKGMAMPSTSSPYTRNEIDLMLDRLDVSGFKAAEDALYARILAYLDKKDPPRIERNLSFSADVVADIEVYARTNIKDFPLIGDWGIPRYRIPEPMLTANLSIGISECINLLINPSLGYVRNLSDTSQLEKTYVYTNLILLPPVGTLDTSVNIPDRALFTFGGDGWAFMLGRGDISWGPGMTGNFIFSDHVPYHDMVRFSGYTDSFKYSFISSFFVHPMNYFYSDEPGGAVTFHPYFTQQDSLDGLSMYMAHRIEWRMNRTIGFALTEALLYQHEENHLDLRIFSPLILFHNLYLKQYANSILSAEIDVAVTKGLDVYFQFVLDDLAIPFVERKAGGVGSSSPDACGYMAGLRFTHLMEKGRFYGGLETAYTDPYLYLRDRGLANEGENSLTYGNSFLIGFREYVSTDKGRYDLLFPGYPFGGDAIVADLKMCYEDYSGWRVGFEFFYMCHGTFGPLTRWNELTDKDYSTPTGDTNGDEYATSGEEPVVKDAPSHTFYVAVNGGYDFSSHFGMSGNLTLKTVVNKDNLKASGSATDVQFTLGFELRY